jgi:hypothetical protein
MSISGIPASPDAAYILGYESTELLGRVCIPSARTFGKLSTAINETFGQAAGQIATGSANYLTSAVDDLMVGWPIILAAAGVCVVLSVVYLCFLKCCAGVMVWFSLFGSIIALAGFGAVLFVWSGELKDFSTSVPLINDTIKAVSSAGSTYQNYKYFAYGLWGAAGVALLLVLCMCSQIRLSIAVAKAAGSFINDTLSVLVIPLINTAVALLVWGLGVTGMIWLISAAAWTLTGPSSIFTSLGSFTDPALLRLYYFFFGVLWFDALVSAFSFFIIASSAALWYYSHGEEAVTNTPVLTSIWRGVRYHFGSLVFGALLVAIIEFVRVAYEFFARQVEQNNPDNKLIECLLCMGRCCLKCLQCLV